jgi:hypothetical protein
MKTLPILKQIKYNSKYHSRYYRLMPSKMAKYEEELKDKGAEIIFEVEDEDSPSSDFIEDEDTLKWIETSYENGNPYAWFSAKVTVKYKSFEATDYLGGCSYKSAKDFKNGGYYWDMVTTCVHEINTEIQRGNSLIQKRWDIRRAKNLISPYGLFIVESNKLPTL